MEGETARHRTAIAGFVAWILTLIGMVAYVIWALVPEKTLNRIGIVYYPDKYWAVAVPAYVGMMFWYYITTYILSYFRNTHPQTDMYCLTDIKAKGSKATLGTLSDQSSSVPPIADIPVTVTSKVFHQAWE